MEAEKRKKKGGGLCGRNLHFWFDVTELYCYKKGGLRVTSPLWLGCKSPPVHYALYLKKEKRLRLTIKRIIIISNYF